MSNNYRKITAGIIIKDRKILSLQRASVSSRSPKRWEFVGGHVEEGETFEEALIREIKEELDCNAKIIELVVDNVYGKPGKETHVKYFLCDVDTIDFKLVDHDDQKWLTNDDLYSVDWLEANKPALEKIKHLID